MKVTEKEVRDALDELECHWKALFNSPSREAKINDNALILMWPEQITNVVNHFLAKQAESKPKPTPMTFAEAMQAVAKGKKVRLPDWFPGHYYTIDDDGVLAYVSQQGTENAEILGFEMCATNWEIYDE